MFIKGGDSLFLLDQTTKTFENFNVPITNYKILASPDNKSLIFWSNNEIYLYSITQPGAPSGSYPKNVEMKIPEIFFNQQAGKLYILTNNILLVSEKITP